MGQRYTVTAKGGQQSVSADGLVGEQAKSVLPGRLDMALGQSFAVQKLPNALRNECVGEVPADENNGLTRKSIGQVVARVENAFSLQSAAIRTDSEIAVVRVAVIRRRQQERQSDDAVGKQSKDEDKGDADVKVNSAEAAEKPRRSNQQGNRQHQARKNEIDRQKDADAFQKTAHGLNPVCNH